MLRKLFHLLIPGRHRIEDMLLYPEGRRIYREFHSLRRENMDQDALKVINRLNRYGYRSYLVGGCVRDMILGKRPKDFDVVTTATPSQIRKVFSNSRAIGRRFKIVHVIFRGKIIEVSTFRSLPAHRLSKRNHKDSDVMLRRDNEYGTPREDAARRDFTINALYFDPRNESIIDYTGGFDDIKNGVIAVIGDPDISFREDPVRMLRAAKFSAMLGFRLDNECIKGIRHNKNEISKASPSRMLEEYSKIFRTGRSSEIFNSLWDTGLLHILFPEAIESMDAVSQKASNFLDTSLGKRLAIADKMLSEREDLTTTIFIALFFVDLVHEVFHGHPIKNAINYVRTQIDPLARRLQLSGRDKDRLMQIFVSQGRFYSKNMQGKNKPEHFRSKIFFYEAFMVFKVHSITVQDEDAIQKAMFWEFGPRAKPPEPSKIVTTFIPRSHHRNSGDRPRRPHDRMRENRKPAKENQPE